MRTMRARLHPENRTCDSYIICVFLITELTVATSTAFYELRKTTHTRRLGLLQDKSLRAFASLASCLPSVRLIHFQNKSPIFRSTGPSWVQK